MARKKDDRQAIADLAAEFASLGSAAARPLGGIAPAKDSLHLGGATLSPAHAAKPDEPTARSGDQAHQVAGDSLPAVVPPAAPGPAAQEHRDRIEPLPPHVAPLFDALDALVPGLTRAQKVTASNRVLDLLVLLRQKAG